MMPGALCVLNTSTAISWQQNFFFARAPDLNRSLRYKFLHCPMRLTAQQKVARANVL
jgi:hypothetical protein